MLCETDPDLGRNIFLAGGYKLSFNWDAISCEKNPLKSKFWNFILFYWL